MEKIAFISGGTFIYWSSIILALAVVTAIAIYMAAYLAKGGNVTGMCLAIPVSMLLSIVFSRFFHWYSRADAYASFGAAMTNYASGGYALMGVFIGCLLTACLLRLLRIIPNLPRMLDAMTIGGGFGINALYVAIGEAAVLLTLGSVLYFTLKKGLARRLFR